MNISAYCERIHYAGPLEPTPQTLLALQRAHLFSVPFENLDIPFGRALRLDEAGLMDKIITRRRGGFCYELNGLFSRLLRGLGYLVVLLNARGLNDDGSLGIDFDHLALMVTCPESPVPRWLVDVGWGNGPLEPLRLEAGLEQGQGGRVFRIADQGGRLVLSEKAVDGRWIPHYAFTLQPRDYSDFTSGCLYHTTSPQSIFTQKRICSRFTPQGMLTLSENHLIITTNGQREERILDGEDDFNRMLKEYFDIVL